jgi:hypothetical protein
MSLINQNTLAKYLDLGLNVLFEGEAGVGKTAIVKQTFENAGMKWMYFSASTLDPWVDFIGIPHAVDDGKGGKVLELIRPRFIVDDDVEAIFLDELNRAPEKVLNAVMELIQFKSINGRRLSKLKVIWAAINPSDDAGTYSVTQLDPAQRDRFQVHIPIPFKVDEDYFLDKYPSNGAEFIRWWNEIPLEIRKKVSPRRLDHAAAAYEAGCALTHFLPIESNPQKLKKSLKNIPWNQQLEEIASSTEAVVFMEDVNNATKLLELIAAKDKQALQFYKKFETNMPKELVDALAPKIYAAETGAPVIENFQDFLNALPGRISDASNTAFINSFDFNTIYRKTGSITADIMMCVAGSPPNFPKLIGHIRSVLTSKSKPVLETALFRTINGAKCPSNIATIIMEVAKQDTVKAVLSDVARKEISGNVYRASVIPHPKWLS